MLRSARSQKLVAFSGHGARPCRKSSATCYKLRGPCGRPISEQVVVCSSVQAKDSQPNSSFCLERCRSSLWEEFSEAASGEWDGVTVTFDSGGSPKQLPEYYVPEAYREWGVELFDWQSQCSMLASDGTLKYCVRRLMPTVGCEADAIAFTEESHEAFGTEHGCAVYASDGSFARSPEGLDNLEMYECSAEHCVPLDRSNFMRLRAVQYFKRFGPDKHWKLSELEMHIERKEGPYTGRRELAGCGGGMPTFGTSPARDSHSLRALAGESWTATGVRLSKENFGGDVRVNSVVDEIWSIPEWSKSDALVCLPRDAWMSSCVSGNDLDLIFGVVLDEGKTMRISRQCIDNGTMREMELLLLRKL